MLRTPCGSCGSTAARARVRRRGPASAAEPSSSSSGPAGAGMAARAPRSRATRSAPRRRARRPDRSTPAEGCIRARGEGRPVLGAAREALGQGGRGALRRARRHRHAAVGQRTNDYDGVRAHVASPPRPIRVPRRRAARPPPRRRPRERQPAAADDGRPSSRPRRVGRSGRRGADASPSASRGAHALQAGVPGVVALGRMARAADVVAAVVDRVDHRTVGRSAHVALVERLVAEDDAQRAAVRALGREDVAATAPAAPPFSTVTTASDLPAPVRSVKTGVGETKPASCAQALDAAGRVASLAARRGRALRRLLLRPLRHRAGPEEEADTQQRGECPARHVPMVSEAPAGGLRLQQVVLRARALGPDLQARGADGVAGDVHGVAAGLDVDLERRRVLRVDGRGDLPDARALRSGRRSRASRAAPCRSGWSRSARSGRRRGCAARRRRAGRRCSR